MSDSKHRFDHDETAVIRERAERSQHGEHATSIYLTSSFEFDNAEHARALFANEVDGNVYSRYSNPNNDEFVARMCALERTEDGISVASGMSAIFTCFAALLKQGDHVLSSRSVFGSTHQVLTQLLPKWGITSSYGDLDDFPGGWEKLVRPETKLCYVETPSNPALDLIDLEELTAFCRSRGIILVVDNIFATPILQKPADYGADIVIHSATKYIDGQGRALGGVILGKNSLIEKIRLFARHSGPCLSSFNAWMFSRSLETLPVRMDRHCHNAAMLADWLYAREGVAWMKYPHHPSHPQYELALKQMKRGGGIVTFAVEGGFDRGRRFLDALKMCSLTANLGDVRTIATHPASTTHSKLSEDERLAVGIEPGLIRISAGLEHIDDIIGDIQQALDASL
jgi:O-succinylhomoserine sulfhydrylase